MAYINPKWVITEFLRSKLSDPRTTRNYELRTINYNSNENQDTFGLTFSNSDNDLSYIDEVSVNGNVMKKWRDYYIEFREKQIIFFEGLNSNDNVEIKLYENVGKKNWIYWDGIVKTMRADNFPRISVNIVNGRGSKLGNYKAPVESVILFQINVYAKEKNQNQVFNIDNRLYSGDDLVERIAFDIIDVFDENNDELYPVFYDYVPSSSPPNDIGFDEEIQCHKRSVDVELRGLKVGRV